MSHSDGTLSSGKKKVDSATPVSPDFWDQFVRDWGLTKYIGNVYSVFFGAMGIRDLAVRLLTYTEISRETEDQEEEVVDHIKKLEPLIGWLDEWMHECIIIPTVRYGQIVPRSIGFYHLRRQNVMPVGFEMRVILEGFTEPIANEDYSEMRSYALYGEEVNGKRVGGVKNICVMMESHFHHIIKVKKVQPLVFEQEGLDIGDEVQRETLYRVAELTQDEKTKQDIINRLKSIDLEDTE